jgi:mannose/fructose/N-acetylgalactosamine-specific phosphotransferase system component IIC
MLAGALILLAASILGTMEDVPTWLGAGLYFVGYILLAYGFFNAMAARRKGPTPRDRG